MDGDLYDEFGNYIGPELESDDSSEGEEDEDQNLQDEVCYIIITPPPHALSPASVLHHQCSARIVLERGTTGDKGDL